MDKDSTNLPGSSLSNVIQIDDKRIRGHLDKLVRGSVEETLNALLDAEADRLIGAEKYERSASRQDTRAGHYERQLHSETRTPLVRESVERGRSDAESPETAPPNIRDGDY